MAAIEPVGWTRRRLFWCVLLLMAVQLGLIWRLSEAPAPGGDIAGAPTAIRLLPPSGDPMAEWFHLDDAALFALINPHGFSGSAWLRLAQFPYRLTHHVNPPTCLEASATDFANDLRQYVKAADRATLLSIPNLPPALSEVTLKEGPRPIVPAVELDGDLANRRLISTEPLPAGEPDKASACVVKVAVNPAGQVVSHVLWTSSGSAATDQQAMEYALTARFEPVDADPAALTFGYLVFRWFAGKLDGNSSATSR